VGTVFATTADEVELDGSWSHDSQNGSAYVLRGVIAIERAAN
jgi:hypothetical protein